MSKIELFKDFVSHNPDFFESVNSGKTTWQKLYELYDLYGENDKVWDSFRKKDETGNAINNIIKNLKNINLDSLEENISSIRNAVSFIEELAISKKSNDKKEERKFSKNINKIERIYDD